MGRQLRRNVARDRETDDLLGVASWEVVRVWEHEDPESAAERIGSRSRTTSLFPIEGLLTGPIPVVCENSPAGTLEDPNVEATRSGGREPV